MYKRILGSLMVVAIVLAFLAMPARAVTENLISNPSAEQTIAGKPNQPLDWQKDKWGTNTTTFSYKATGHNSGHSLYVNTTSYTDGDAKWFFKPVEVQPNTSYVFSDWYKSSLRTELVAQFTDANGNNTYRWITGAAKSSAWKQTNTTITTPADVKTMSVLHILGGVGWLQTDDFSLSKKVVSQNAVSNASFETQSPTDTKLPEGWQTSKSGTNTTTFTYQKSAGHTGSRSARIDISNYTSGDASWNYGPQPVTGGKTYEFYDYYQSNVDTEIYAHIIMGDGSERWEWIGAAKHSAGWNQFYQQFQMPAGAVAAEVYHAIFAVGYLVTDDYKLAPYTPQGFNEGMVSLTFDDGLRSIYTNGLPALQKYGFPSTQYFLSGYTNDPYYMTVDMMLAFKNAGHEVASHTVTHPSLTSLNSADLDFELSQSKASLTSWLGVTPAAFASPHGEYNAETLTQIKRYYQSHRSVDTGFNSKDNFDRYNIKVQNVVLSTTAEQIAAWVAQAKAERTWLVLVYHAVDEPANVVDGNWNTPPATLDAHFAAIKASGIKVMTLGQALNAITPQL